LNHVRRGRTAFPVAVAAAALLAILGATSASGGRSASIQGTITYGSFQSKAVRATLHYAVYLPPDYGYYGKRYPVVYFLHGLPASPTSYRAIQPVAQAVESSGHEAIVVSAQGSKNGDSDPEWHDWKDGRNWETATSRELVAAIDKRYSTIANRSGQLLIGISAGGYGATLIALHHPAVYSVVESWSGYFHATNPAGTASLDLGSGEANDWANAHKLIPRVRRLLTAYGPHTYFAFYVGTDDKLFRAENIRFYDELRKAGIRRVVFRIYKGAHNWSLWGRHDADWIADGLTVAAQPSG
jgi:S-formylglutathione hydrolase FrmB